MSDAVINKQDWYSSEPDKSRERFRHFADTSPAERCLFVSLSVVDHCRRSFVLCLVVVWLCHGDSPDGTDAASQPVRPATLATTRKQVVRIDGLGDVYLKPSQQRHRRQVLGVMPAVRPHYVSAQISRHQAEVD